MKSTHAVARVTFTANRDLVRNALAEGWSAKAIYEQNQPRLSGISYRQFVRYVNRMRDADTPTYPSHSTAASPPQPQGNTDARPAQHPTIARTFEHNPQVTEATLARILGPRKKD